MEKEGKKHQFFIGSSHVQYICSCFCEKNLCYQESANFSVNNTLLPSITFLRSLSNVHAFLFSFLTCTFTFSFSLFHFSLVLSLFLSSSTGVVSPKRAMQHPYFHVRRRPRPTLTFDLIHGQDFLFSFNISKSYTFMNFALWKGCKKLSLSVDPVY